MLEIWKRHFIISGWSPDKSQEKMLALRQFIAAGPKVSSLKHKRCSRFTINATELIFLFLLVITIKNFKYKNFIIKTQNTTYAVFQNIEKIFGVINKKNPAYLG